MLLRPIFAMCALLLAGNCLALDINRATEAELDSINGIGPAMSARILQQRASAPFTDWADLIARVPGVGAASAQRFSEQGLTVNHQAFDASTYPGKSKRKHSTRVTPTLNEHAETDASPR